MSIEKFRGENYYLSSMFPLENGIVLPDGREVPCVEIAYLPERFEREEDREQVLAAMTGFEAKKITKRLVGEGSPVRPDWEIGRLVVMKACVAQKFERNPDLAERLISTGEQEIVEGNGWGDKFWGVSPVGSRNGQNNLGRILMNERRLLIENQKRHTLGK